MTELVETETLEVTEAESLRSIAKDMNIKVGNLQDVTKLKALIAEKNKPVEVKLNATALKHKKREVAKRELMKLVRVKISANSPFEKQLPSVTIDAGNSIVGQVQRTIQFDEVWHVEQILLNTLREKKYRAKKETVDPITRRKVAKNVFHKSYTIEILPQMSETELKDLAATQAATGAID